MANMLEIKSDPSRDCCTLRTVTIIIAMLQIIGGIGILIITWAVSNRWEEKIPGVDYDIAKIYNIAKILDTIVLCLMIFTATLLLVGVYKKNTYLMLPWLVLAVVVAIITIFNTIHAMIIYNRLNNVSLCIGYLVLGLMKLVLHIQFWRVVYSYFKQLKNEKVIGYRSEI